MTPLTETGVRPHVAVVDHPSDSTDALLQRYQVERTLALRNEIVEANLWLGDYFVRRYSTRGVPVEDLRQVASMAIVLAVERFDPAHGVALRTFASRTIDGELKRYFRDHTWVVRPTRRLVELHLWLRTEIEDLTHRLGHAPPPAEIAVETGATERDVRDALEAAVARYPGRIDHGERPDDGPVAHLPASERAERQFDAVLDRLTASAVLDHLADRQRQVLEMRYLGGHTQHEVARTLGLSQSYLSRLERKALTKLRTQFEIPAA